MVAVVGQGGAPGAGGGGGRDQSLDLAGEDGRDPRVNLAAGLVVASAETTLDARERVLGLSQCAFAGGGDLACFLGGVDVRDAQLQRLASLGAGDLPVAQRAAVARAQLGGQVALARRDIAQWPQPTLTDIGQVALAKPGACP